MPENSVAVLDAIPSTDVDNGRVEIPRQPLAKGLFATHLTLPKDLSIDDWGRLGKKLVDIQGSVNWWVGDWLNFGQRAYGKKYKLAIEITGKSYSTLSKYSFVADKFQIFRRRKNLSWSHHCEAASLTADEQDRWLDQCESEGWSVSELGLQISDAPDNDEAIEDSGDKTCIGCDVAPSDDDPETSLDEDEVCVKCNRNFPSEEAIDKRREEQAEAESVRRRAEFKQQRDEEAAEAEYEKTGRPIAAQVLKYYRNQVLARPWGIEEQYGSVEAMFQSELWQSGQNRLQIGEVIHCVEDAAEVYRKFSQECQAYAKKHGL